MLNFPFFVRVDYIYDGSPVQHVRTICYTFSEVRKLIRDVVHHDKTYLLSIKVKRISSYEAR